MAPLRTHPNSGGAFEVTAAVDCQNSHTWGGTAYDWTNPTHVNQANMRRLLRYVVAHSGGALN